MLLKDIRDEQDQMIHSALADSNKLLLFLDLLLLLLLLLVLFKYYILVHCYLLIFLNKSLFMITMP